MVGVEASLEGLGRLQNLPGSDRAKEEEEGKRRRRRRRRRKVGIVVRVLHGRGSVCVLGGRKAPMSRLSVLSPPHFDVFRFVESHQGFPTIFHNRNI
jgi:hypothetical protein